MGIVKISENMHENLRVASDALSRSINAQAEHWMRIGMLAELHPNLDHSDICRLLIRAESSGGLDLKQLCAAADIAQGSQPQASSGASQ
ncbi:ParD-like family protein [Pseudomonas mohnii]